MTNQSIEPARSFHVHAFMLNTSHYFKALLQRCEEEEERASKRRCIRAALPAAGAAPSKHKQIELVELVEEDQLEAAEMVLRCMYEGGKLPAQAQAHGQLLLRMYRIADKYQLQPCCMEAIAGGLSALQPEQLDKRMLSAVFGLPTALYRSDHLESLREKCADKLVETFGDVPAVIKSDDLKEQFCALPYEAVLTWLKVRSSEMCVFASLF